MSDKIYIGIDGGGTYTKAVAVSSSGKAVCRECGETINFNAVGFDSASKNLEAVFDRITEKIPKENISRVFIGCSALDSRADGETVKKLMGRYSSLTVDIDSDLYVALYGHTFGKKGAMIVSGTGSMGIAMSDGGDIFVCGGWGYAIGDEGSAYRIATEGLRAVSKMADGRAKKTLLYEAAMNYYGISEPYALAEKIYLPHFSRNGVAKFAKIVSECAKKGDSTAIAVLDSASEELVLLASTLLRKSGISDEIAVYGGVLLHNEYILTRLKALLCRDFPGITVTFPKAMPEIGAVAAAMNADGILTDSIIRIISQIK